MVLIRAATTAIKTLPPMTQPLTAGDLERLKQALLDSDHATQQFLGPILGLAPVQQLLLSFLKDQARSFEDHVWDAKTQLVLTRLRGIGLDAHAQETSIHLFNEELQRQAGAIGNELMEEVDQAQADGKTKFKRGDYYPAMNAFKKSLAALLNYHQDEYYGKAIAPVEWEEDSLKQRYVMLSTNVAVCAIKLRDPAAIRLHANNALRVDPQNSKALYALIKVNLMQKMYEEARATLKEAMAFHPDNDQFTKLLVEIDSAEGKELAARAELLALKEARERDEEEEKLRLAKAEEERKAELARKEDATLLPELDDDGQAARRLNTYFMRIKHELNVTVDQVHNPDNAEAPLFECSLIDGTTQMALAVGVRGSSKRAAKSDAAKLAVIKLWEIKRDAGKLLPEEQAAWTAYETAHREGRVYTSTHTPTAETPTDSEAGATENAAIEITMFERQLEPAALLHQLAQQRQLRSLEFSITDVSPEKNDPLFHCACLVNGEELAAATAPSKKKAKSDAARQAIDIAVQRGMIVCRRPMQAQDGMDAIAT